VIGRYEMNDRREEHEMDARIFVVMRDNFFSGWGSAPRTSFFVVACPNVSIAESVAWYAENKRTEMKYISVKLGSLKDALSGRKIGADDHVSVIGVNPQWCGWDYSEEKAQHLRGLWEMEIEV